MMEIGVMTNFMYFKIFLLIKKKLINFHFQGIGTVYQDKEKKTGEWFEGNFVRWI